MLFGKDLGETFRIESYRKIQWFMLGKETVDWSSTAGPRALSLPLIGCVTFSKLLSLSVLCSSHLYSSDNHSEEVGGCVS